jgi:hypothetical protein
MPSAPNGSNRNRKRKRRRNRKFRDQMFLTLAIYKTEE